MDARIDEELEVGVLSGPVNFLPAAISKEEGDSRRMNAWGIGPLMGIVSLISDDCHIGKKLPAERRYSM